MYFFNDPRDWYSSVGIIFFPFLDNGILLFLIISLIILYFLYFFVILSSFYGVSFTNTAVANCRFPTSLNKSLILNIIFPSNWLESIQYCNSGTLKNLVLSTILLKQKHAYQAIWIHTISASLDYSLKVQGTGL